ncbi:hypothetical protein BP422_21800 [Brevibacillus formosus]|uniref:Pyrrolo-quinoline quinone repeat domain-containing protein n=1 Tax=Brevibacillus formosus TaxID=54913 RepID=A0A220MLD9_9BACL|nr:PQQ-binding-like beta-propeller repeat protein [Brevibacillus formosus]ASJ55946.1 hypothetical protein BP422_21800 [Brevibacillus formosus]
MTLFTHTLAKKLSPKRIGMTSLALVSASSLLWAPLAHAAESPEVEWEKSYKPDTYALGNYQEQKHGGILFTKRQYSQTKIMGIDESGEISTKLTLPDKFYVAGMDQTNDGGYILSSHNQNIRIMKTNKHGKILWEKTIDKQPYSTFGTVIQTSKEEYLIASSIRLPDNSTETYVAKLDEEGELLWEKKIKDISPSGFQETTDGNVILTGVLTKTVNDYLNNYDLYVSKIDSEGNTVWEITHETGNSTSPSQAVATPDGGVIIASTDSTINYVPERTGYLVKVSGDGSVQWEKTLPRELSYSGLKYIHTTEDGNYILNGYINYQQRNMNYGYSDEYIAKIDEDGNTLWDKTFAGKWDDEFAELCENRGGVIITQTKDGGYLEVGIDENKYTLNITKLKSE